MAFTYDTKVNSARANSNPKTFNHTCASGTTLLVLTLVIDGATARTGGAPTYNSVEMTQADSARQATSSPETTVEMWYMLEPPTGSAYQISIPNSGSVYLTAESASFKTPAGNTTALLAASYATNTSANPTGPTHSSTRSGDLVIAVLGYGDDTNNYTASGTELYGTDEGTYVGSAQWSLVDGTSTYLKWTDATSEDWVIVSAVFREMAKLTTPAVAVSKAVGYGVLRTPDAVNVSKAVGYGVLRTPDAVNVSKAVAYAVLVPDDGASDVGPMMWIF